MVVRPTHGACGEHDHWCTLGPVSVSNRLPAPLGLWLGVALAGVLVVAACRKSEAATVEHAPVELDQAQRATLARFGGQWKHIGGQKEQAAAVQAVDEVVAEMNALFRGVARSRLVAAVHIDKALSIVETQGIVTIDRSEQAQPFRAPADGLVHDMETNDGDEARGSLRISGSTLVARVETEQGGGERTYRIDDKGHLVITSRTFSPRLPADVVHTARYARP